MADEGAKVLQGNKAHGTMMKGGKVHPKLKKRADEQAIRIKDIDVFD